MDTSGILVTERDGDLVTLTMNRPPANAVNFDLTAALLESVRALAAEDVPPGLVLTGQGDRFFSAGGDIKEVAAGDTAAPRIRIFHALLCAMEQYSGPIVCAVRGYAVGGALEFLLHADHVVANAECRISFPEINHGLLPATKGMRKASERLGLRQAQMLLYWGELVDARKAMEIGAINEIVPTAEVMARAVDVCRTLRGKDQKLFAAIKRSLNLTARMDDAALEEMTVRDLDAYLTGDSSAEARTRFLSKNTRGG
ncbi:enoyl-CoA hydratase/isomerase family protein [Bradyrhizobium sp. USDA 3256]